MHAALTPLERPTELAGIPRPIAGFVGQLGDHLDWGLLRAVADTLPDVRFVLVGPASAAAVELPVRPNVYYLGPRSHQRLPAYLAHFDVALLPFADTPRVRYAHPTKVREYLAAGCPVVATPHPEIEELSPHVVTQASAPAFAAAVRRCIDHPPDRGALSRSLAAHDWSERAYTLETWATAA
jgi:glycosyltransferase involved in cell wall biosynthesis